MRHDHFTENWNGTEDREVTTAAHPLCRRVPYPAGLGDKLRNLARMADGGSRDLKWRLLYVLDEIDNASGFGLRKIWGDDTPLNREEDFPDV